MEHFRGSPCTTGQIHSTEIERAACLVRAVGDRQRFCDLKLCPSQSNSNLFSQAVAFTQPRIARRKVAGWWKRLSRWEFWPPYLFYPPVVAYIAYLGIRFRSWTLFTAANPAIPAGGFVGESKHQILDQLKGAAAWLPVFHSSGGRRAQ